MPERRSRGGRSIDERFLEALRGLNVWRNGGQRAPHKPFLLLLALARVHRGESRLISYTEVADDLRDLLDAFGPPRKTLHPEYPFWHLQNDDVWDFETDGPRLVREASSSPSDAALRRAGARGGFSEEFDRRLRKDPGLLSRAVEILLDDQLPATLHDELLARIGFESGDGEGDRVWVQRTRRDPGFSERVLRAYGFRCALCGFHLEMTGVSIGLDAAHIRWKQASGPDHETNGIGLCALHHRLFDRGAFTIADDVALVSSRTSGESLGGALLQFHRQGIRLPDDPGHRPSSVHLSWHLREVFRDPPHR